MESTWLKEQRAKQLARALKRSGLSPRQQETLEGLDRRWARDGLTLPTRHHYVAHAKRLGKILGKPFEEATRSDLEAYVDRMIPDYAEHTVAATKRFLKVFYKQLLQHDEAGHPDVVAWIRVKNSATSRKLPKDMLTIQDVEAIARATSHPRDRALIMVLYESAARASELISMRVGDVEFDAYGARVTLTGKTGQRRVRLLSSVPDLQQWMESHPRRDDVEAPLWTSWGHQNHHEPLMYAGLSKILHNAVDLAGIRKRVHPHLFRHSRLTELAKRLSESELKVVAGWTADSSMAKVYIHLSGDDVDRKMLAEAGLLGPHDQQEAARLEVQECPRCAAQNSPAARFCGRCTMPLDEETSMQEQEQHKALMEQLPRLLRILDDPKVAARLKEMEEPSAA